MTLGLPIGSHVMFKANINGKDEYRKYTPISDVTRRGFVDFVIKIYRANEHPKFPEGGKMTQHLDQLKIGDVVRMKGPLGKLQYLGFGNFKEDKKDQVKKTQIGYLAGGTGITPCFHVLQSSLRNKDGIKHSMLFGNRTVNDIILKDELHEFAQHNGEHFKLYFTVDIAPPAEVKWT